MNDLSKLTRQPYEKNEAGPAWSPKSLKSWILCRLDRSTLRSLLAWTNFTSWLAATEQLAQIAGIERGTTILDAGSGLGGPSRYLASTYGCRVIGADLSPSFVAVAQVLAQRNGLDALVSFYGPELTSAQRCPESAESFVILLQSRNV